jgi:hypothetical protein
LPIRPQIFPGNRYDESIDVLHVGSPRGGRG